VTDEAPRRRSSRLIPGVLLPGGQGRQAPSSTTERLEAFSDGVIAIAITLLILEINVPSASQGHLFDALVDLWPSYLAFILSFAVIGIMWVSHHSMFERIASVDRPLVFLNLLLLMGIAFLPFPTALLARYIQQGGDNAKFAAAMYSTTMMAVGIFFVLIWYRLYRQPQLLVAGIGADRARTAMLRSLVGPMVSIGLAFISPEACFVVYFLIALYFAGGPSSRVATPDAPDATPSTDEEQ
jgi:uncharacterized membrane protein